MNTIYFTLRFSCNHPLYSKLSTKLSNEIIRFNIVLRILTSSSCLPSIPILIVFAFPKIFGHFDDPGHFSHHSVAQGHFFHFHPPCLDTYHQVVSDQMNRKMNQP